jgi:glutathione-regulated potassium-efflux system ancillary protein KefG
MRYLPPFVVHGTHRLVHPNIEEYAIQYRQLLVALTEDRIPETQWQEVMYLNDLNLIPQPL